MWPKAQGECMLPMHVHVLADVNYRFTSFQTSALSPCRCGRSASQCLLPGSNMMKPQQQHYKMGIHCPQSCCKIHAALCSDLVPHPPSHKLQWFFTTTKDFFTLCVIRKCPCGNSPCSLIKDYSPSSGRETHLGNYDLSPARLSNLFDNFQTLNNLSRQFTHYKLY